LIRELFGHHAGDVTAMVVYYKRKNSICRVIVGDIPRRDLALVACGASWIERSKRFVVDTFHVLFTRRRIASIAMSKNVGIWKDRDIDAVRGEALKIMRSYSTF
jgi:hypothetical protein